MYRILYVIAFATATTAGQQPTYITSPNGSLRAQIVSVGHDNIEDSYDIIKIFRGNDEVTEYPLLEQKMVWPARCTTPSGLLIRASLSS